MKALGIVGASGALLAVMLGALGAHGLKTVLGESALHAFNTAVEYQMYHSLAVLLVCALPVCQHAWLLQPPGVLLPVPCCSVAVFMA